MFNSTILRPNYPRDLCLIKDINDPRSAQVALMARNRRLDLELDLLVIVLQEVT